MSQEPQTVSIRLLDKEFTVNCPPEARAELEAAARYLDEKMADIRRSGKLIGLERIAVMAALNISHELIKERSEQSGNLNADVQQLCHKIDNALGSAKRREPKATD